MQHSTYSILCMYPVKGTDTPYGTEIRPRNAGRDSCNREFDQPILIVQHSSLRSDKST